MKVSLKLMSTVQFTEELQEYDTSGNKNEEQEFSPIIEADASYYTSQHDNYTDHDLNSEIVEIVYQKYLRTFSL